MRKVAEGAGSDLTIVYRPVDELIPYAKNARTHSDDQVAQLAASIQEFGWTNPILVDGSAGIIAGHGRVLAARKLGMPQVPCIELAGLSAAQRRAYVLADNQLALNAGWDESLLRIEMADLREMAFDLSLIGFGAAEQAGLMTPEGEAEGGGHAPGGGDPVISYNIIFDDEAQQQGWFGLLRLLRERYPEEETTGARIAAFVGDTL